MQPIIPDTLYCRTASFSNTAIHELFSYHDNIRNVQDATSGCSPFYHEPRDATYPDNGHQER